MAEEDRQRWDARYADAGPMPVVGDPPPTFVDHLDLFPSSGRALDIACGRGHSAVWLAWRGLRVLGLDVSRVAIQLARDLAVRSGVKDHCEFEIVDLDGGLPPGPSVEMVLCHRFRARHLDEALVQRLVPGGTLAIAVLSEVDDAPGPYRATPGELRRAFGGLDVVAEEEKDGVAWLIARRPG